jgi:hypothetical protein
MSSHPNGGQRICWTRVQIVEANIYHGGGIGDTSNDADMIRLIGSMTSRGNSDRTIRLRHPEYAEPGSSLKSVDGETVLVLGKESIPLPDELLQKSSSGELHNDISALTSTKCVYVAVHDNPSRPYQLACLDRVSGKIIWKSEVWGTSWVCAGTGVYFMILAIVEQDNRVIVFGWGFSGMNVEGFRVDDGSNLFRFSTSYITTWQ